MLHLVFCFCIQKADACGEWPLSPADNPTDYERNNFIAVKLSKFGSIKRLTCRLYFRILEFMQMN